MYCTTTLFLSCILPWVRIVQALDQVTSEQGMARREPGSRGDCFLPCHGPSMVPLGRSGLGVEKGPAHTPAAVAAVHLDCFSSVSSALCSLQ